MAADQSEHVIVIGGGLVGLASARALLERGHRVTVLEKEGDWARHQSGHNSGVIHSGLYYKPGSLKARFATEAARTLPRLCEELGVAHAITGKLVVATEAAEIPRMHALLERGLANDVPVREIGVGEVAGREPHVRARAALLVESTGVCDFVGLARALAHQLAADGAELRLGTEVIGLHRVNGKRGGVRPVVRTSTEDLRADRVVNCSGLFSDRLLTGEDADSIRIVPFRGEFWTLRRPELVNGLVYPVPDPDLPFLGIHLTRGWDGHVHLGPNAVLALAQEGYRWRDFAAADLWRSASYPGLWRMARQHWANGIGEASRSLVPPLFLRRARRMLPELTVGDLQRSPAGVRAQAVTRDGKPSDDFVIRRTDRVVHVVNAPSPAATACIQIGRHIAGLALAE